MTAAAYAQLRDRWYDRLARAGFRDIEPRDNPDGPLSGWASSQRRPNSAQGRSREEYYRLGCQAVHTAAFRARFTARRRRIIRLHLGTRDGQALSHREIRLRLSESMTFVERTIEYFRDWLRQSLGFLPSAVVREVARTELQATVARNEETRGQDLRA